MRFAERLGPLLLQTLKKWLTQRQYATFRKNDETISQHWLDKAPKKREDQNRISCSTSQNLIRRGQGGQARLLKSACRTERYLIQRHPGRRGVRCPSTRESTKRQYTRDVRRGRTAMSLPRAASDCATSNCLQKTTHFNT